MITLFKYLRHHLKLIFLALVLTSLERIFVLIDPIIFGHLIDLCASKFTEYSFENILPQILLQLSAWMGVVLVARVLKNLQDYAIHVVSLRVGRKLYNDGLAHSLRLPFSVFEDQRSGQTLSKLNKVKSDVEKLIFFFINVVYSVFIGFVLATIYAWTVHWLIAPMFILAFPLIAYSSYYLSNKIKSIQSTIVKESNELGGTTTESLRNIELVKSLGLANQEIYRLNSATGKILNLELQKVKLIRFLGFAQMAIVNLIRTSIIFGLFYLTYTQEITPGQFFTLYVYSFNIFGPLRELGNLISLYRETEVSFENFHEILNTPIEASPENPISIGSIESLEFENVAFNYASASIPSVTNISFKAKLGSTIAFVGPSGAGKTTLAKLLVGLYKPVRGNILYNNEAADLINLQQLREQVGLVTQDAQLFAGSIRDNLLFVKPTASDDECLEVIHKASCTDLLRRGDKGLDTVIGEGGIKISGGEKQRLSIARALLRNPTLIIFDEATSSLDSLTEKEITNTVREISKKQKQITILIAHRLSTVMHADTIFVMERGGIVESGKHETLLQEKGLYYAMWRQQIGQEVVV